VNYRLGIAKLIEYLHNMGHEKFGFIGHHSALGPLNERYKSVFDTVASYGSGVEVRASANADSLEGGREAARMLLTTAYRPSAIICVNDVMAAGALRELRAKGLRVPDDISVTGFDNIKLSEFCSPSLTTLHIPRDQIGRTICECLIPQKEGGEHAAREFVLDPELIVRESTGPVAAPKPLRKR
jgi:DNA-binding LacI/PurR family transcriptional regulator